MKKIIGIIGATPIALCLALALALGAAGGCEDLIQVQSMGGEETLCENVGEVYPDDPFHGWPIPGAGWGDVTAYYCDPTYYEMFGRTHWGIDIAAPDGTEATATAEGTIVAAEFHDTAGNYIRLCDDAGWCAVYAHLQGFAVQTGDSVVWGQTIGWVDNTGRSTGPHLHYQIEDPQGRPVDPAPTM